MWREFPDHPAVNLQKRCDISRFWSGFLRQPKHDSQHSRRIPTFRLKNRRTFAPFTSLTTVALGLFPQCCEEQDGRSFFLVRMLY